MRENRILSLLEQGDWGEDTPLIQGLKTWRFYPLLLETYRTMDEDALYKSRVHGSGHIHRVRLKDLDAKFMRHESAKALVPFAWRLMDLNQAWKHRDKTES